MKVIIAALTVLGAAVALPPATTAQAAPAPCADTPFTATFDRELRARWPRNRFTAAVVDLRTGCEYVYRPDLRITTASVFKIEVLAGVLLRAQRERRPLTAREDALVRPMITESANPPTTTLFHELGGTAGFARLNGTFGLAETEAAPRIWGLTHTSARDQVHLLRQVLLGDGPLDGRSRATAWRYMGAVVPSQRWGMGEEVPAGFTVGLKNGFAGSHCCGWRINSAGVVVDRGGHGWAAAILTDGWPTEAAGREAMSFVARSVNGAMAAAGRPACPRTGAAARVLLGDGAAVGIDGARPRGHWVVTDAGAVRALDGAPHLGDMAAVRLNAPVVSMAATVGRRGYWLLGADGGVFSFGDARFRGSTGAMRLNAPVVSMAPTPTGGGYWLLGRDGGVFSFGDARFHGSIPGVAAGRCTGAPAVRIRATSTGRGYWILTADGAIHRFGDATALASPPSGWPVTEGALDMTNPDDTAQGDPPSRRWLPGARGVLAGNPAHGGVEMQERRLDPERQASAVTCRVCFQWVEVLPERVDETPMYVYYRCQGCEASFTIRRADIKGIET